ncbi:MAG: hypothetical protein OXE42_12340 [Gammaproteobacteria bacterium]|nr:hypothetical protein [Gammaproteobacteria bacterium]
MSVTRCQLPEATWSWLIIAILSMPATCFPAGTEDFGRLFTTRDERQRLQQLREENRDPAGTGNPEMNGSHDTRQIQTGLARRQEGAGNDTPVITLKGLIYTKDRAGMVWLNGKDGKPVQLKPGQSYHLHSGAVTDLEANTP